MFTRLFYSYIYVGSAKHKESDYRGHRDLDDRDAPYIGKTIGNIFITRLEPFGTNLLDTSVVATGLLRKANLLHIRTRERVVRKTLLFHRNDTIKPFQISDSERLLRDQEYIKDARIRWVYRRASADTVDVMVIEKDIWSLLLTVPGLSARTADIQINERNFAGTGLWLDQLFKVALDQPLGYQGRFIMPNILGRFYRGELAYTKIPNLEYWKVLGERQFITPDIRQGGGLGFQRTQTLDTLYQEEGGILQTNPVKFDHFNAWAGYNIPINRQNKSGTRDGIFPAVGYDQLHYLIPPAGGKKDTLLYPDTKTLFTSLTFSQRKYFTDNLVFGFGRTEDIPVGFRLELVGGYQFGEFRNRRYASVSVAHAIYLPTLGFTSNTASFGGFFSGQQTMEEGLFKWKILIISRMLAEKYRFKMRNYLTFDVVVGINRKANETRRIDDEYGIPGLNSDSLRGQSTAVINYTNLIFTPWQPLGFRIALSTFLNIGYVGPDSRPIFANRPYIGFGGGFQCNNENLIFGNINLRIGFYPSTPADAASFSFSISFNPVLRFEQLDPQPPNVLIYKN